MNNLFGTGRIAPGTGIVLAASPAAKPTPLLAAAIAWRGRAFRAAVGGSGQNEAGLAAASAMAQALAGGEIAAVPDPGRANAISCPQYVPGGRQAAASRTIRAARDLPPSAGSMTARGRRGRALRRMLKAGKAAAVPAFLAMDVAAAANRIQAALAPGDPRVIHMEIGQPGTPAPPVRGAPRRPRSAAAARSATPMRRGGRRCGRASPRTTRTGTAAPSIRRASPSRPAGRARFRWCSWRRSIPATAWRWRRRTIRLT